jgi:hypothetical protein
MPMKSTVLVYQNRFRRRRFALFLTLVDEIIARKGQCSIADVGGRMESWEAFRQAWVGRNITVSLINVHIQPVIDRRFQSIEADARDLSKLADNSFDIVFSNSVIEHVGGWADQKRMADEVQRIAPRHFVQTPNYWFPFEPHFQLLFIHWLPLAWRIFLVRHRACGFYPRARTSKQAISIIEDAHLLDAGSMAVLFPQSIMKRERLILTKSIIAIGRPAADAVL